MTHPTTASFSEINSFISDGSVSSLGIGGCACRVSIASSGDPLKIMAILGEVTTTQAELLGGVLGLAVLRVRKKEETLVAKWSCDCKTVIDSANRLKNELDEPVVELQTDLVGQSSGLEATWKLYQHASNKIEVIPVWSGEPQSLIDVDVVDKASRWASVDGEKLLRKWGEGPVGRLKYLNPTTAWVLVDLRFLSLEIDPRRAYEQLVARLDRVL